MSRMLIHCEAIVPERTILERIVFVINVWCLPHSYYSLSHFAVTCSGVVEQVGISLSVNDLDPFG